MSNVELIFFLVGGLLMLGLTLWSVRSRDLESRGDAKLPLLFGLHSLFLFVAIGVRALSELPELGDAQRLAAGVIAGSFSACAILMLARAFQMRRA